MKTNFVFSGLCKICCVLHSNAQEAESAVGGDELSFRPHHRVTLTMSLVGLYMPLKNLILIAGFGREFEKTVNLSLIDFGLEYGFEFPDEWELSLNLK